MACCLDHHTAYFSLCSTPSSVGCVSDVDMIMPMSLIYKRLFSSNSTYEHSRMLHTLRSLQ